MSASHSISPFDAEILNALSKQDELRTFRDKRFLLIRSVKRNKEGVDRLSLSQQKDRFQLSREPKERGKIFKF